MVRRAPSIAAALDVALIAPTPQAASKRPTTETDLLKFTWIADPQIAPDSRRSRSSRHDRRGGESLQDVAARRPDRRDQARPQDYAVHPPDNLTQPLDPVPRLARP